KIIAVLGSGIGRFWCSAVGFSPDSNVTGPGEVWGSNLDRCRGSAVWKGLLVFLGFW
ncbi:hypothetical protein KI387_006485, partial [Taxus chinensis]